MTFSYFDGGSVAEGNDILAAGKPATVRKVIQPNTEDAQNYSCSETGGILLAFEDGDLQLWPEANEDLIRSIARGKSVQAERS